MDLLTEARLKELAETGEKFHSCVDQVKGKKGTDSSHAICHASLGETDGIARIIQEHHNPLDIPTGTEQPTPTDSTTVYEGGPGSGPRKGGGSSGKDDYYKSMGGAEGYQAMVDDALDVATTTGDAKQTATAILQHGWTQSGPDVASFADEFRGQAKAFSDMANNPQAGLTPEDNRDNMIVSEGFLRAADIMDEVEAEDDVGGYMKGINDNGETTEGGVGSGMKAKLGGLATAGSMAGAGILDKLGTDFPTVVGHGVDALSKVIGDTTDPMTDRDELRPDVTEGGGGGGVHIHGWGLTEQVAISGSLSNLSIGDKKRSVTQELERIIHGST